MVHGPSGARSPRRNQTLTIMVVPRSGRVLSFNVKSATLRWLGGFLAALLLVATGFGFRYLALVRQTGELIELRRINERQKQQIDVLTKELETIKQDVDKIRETEERVRDLLRSNRELISKGLSAEIDKDGNILAYRPKLPSVPVYRGGPRAIQRTPGTQRDASEQGSAETPLALCHEVRSLLDETLAALASTSANLERTVADLRALPTAWPVQGKITSGFGVRRSPFGSSSQFHEGVDIAAPYGSPVHAAGDGTVIYSGYKPGLGLTVTLDHGNGITSSYAHLSRSYVRNGERVAREARVGAVGRSGRTTGAHLHFEVRKNGVPVDPVGYIGQQKPGGSDS